MIPKRLLALSNADCANPTKVSFILFPTALIPFTIPSIIDLPNPNQSIFLTAFTAFSPILNNKSGIAVINAFIPLTMNVIILDPKPTQSIDWNNESALFPIVKWRLYKRYYAREKSWF